MRWTLTIILVGIMVYSFGGLLLAFIFSGGQVSD